MATISIDTHSAFKRLTESGFPKPQAEAVVETLKDATLENVASKKDIQDLKDEILQAKVDIFKWAVPLLIGQVVLFTAIVAIIVNLIG